MHSSEERDELINIIIVTLLPTCEVQMRHRESVSYITFFCVCCFCSVLRRRSSLLLPSAAEKTLKNATKVRSLRETNSSRMRSNSFVLASARLLGNGYIWQPVQCRT